MSTPLAGKFSVALIKLHALADEHHKRTRPDNEDVLRMRAFGPCCS
jgi:hypothetical protein